MSYSLLKSIHLIFVVSWFTGLFYVFRLFVYHVQNWENQSIRSIFSTMERRLLNYIMLPAAIGSTALGLLLLKSNPGLINSTWIWVKFGFVILLYSYHALAWWVYLRMSLGHKVFSEKACRTINEVPTIVLIAISILVFLKPTF